MTHFDTNALHAGYTPADHNNAGAVPIYQSSAFTFDSAEHAAKLFNLEEFGSIYTRINNPTQDILEKRVASLEGGSAALALSSGQSAQFITITTLCNSGDNFISSSHLYGGSYTQFDVSFRKIGIDTRFFHPDKPEDIESLIDENTRAIYVESISNPAFSIVDFDKISEIAKKYHLPIVVDNTVPSPVLFRPFEHGANIVLHSLTKYLGGHGTSMGGIIVDGGNFDWGKTDRFPTLTQPSAGYHGLVFNDVFGKDCPFGNIAFAIKARVEGLRDYGTAISPFNAFQIIQGIETVSLRVKHQSKNIKKLAEFLENHPKVENVFAPFLQTSKYKENADKYFPDGCPGILSFELKDGQSAGENFVESVKIALHETNLGDSRTVVTHPASTTHRQLSIEAKKSAGVSLGLIRVSLGLEYIDDIIADFEQAIG